MSIRGAGALRWAAAGAALAVCAVGVWAAGALAAAQVSGVLRTEAASAAVLHAAVLRSELEKHRSLPFVLAEDPDVAALLRTGAPGLARALDAKLEGLSERTRAAVIYLLDARGLTLAASNWRRPDSFVGSRYGFRPYFTGALRDGVAESFALGTVSGRPGLFLARRVGGADTPLGVVVVKVEFDSLEAEWRRGGAPAYVTDTDGVVVITSEPTWRFRTERPVAPARRASLAAERRFGAAPLAPLPFRPEPGGLAVAEPDGRHVRFTPATAPAASPGWRVHLLQPAEPDLGSAVVAARIVALLSTVLLAGAAALLLRRREALRLRAEEREAARRRLEAEVADRTAELRDANGRLLVEIDERRRAESHLQLLQEELVQANKLAVLGQISAGVAHEINQPVAAIRTYADTAVRLLERERPEGARENLRTIAGLTERIRLITDELRAFARKAPRGGGEARVEEAVAGALLLTAATLKRGGVRLVREGEAAGLVVAAERLRLEQVLVNLLQNAAEALAGAPDPEVRILVTRTAEEVGVEVADNGPGLSPAMAQALFTPFSTDKPHGLGLGLVISRDIVREFGGALELVGGSARGAAFRITLKRRP